MNNVFKIKSKINAGEWPTPLERINAALKDIAVSWHWFNAVQVAKSRISKHGTTLTVTISAWSSAKNHGLHHIGTWQVYVPHGYTKHLRFRFLSALPVHDRGVLVGEYDYHLIPWPLSGIVPNPIDDPFNGAADFFPVKS